MGVMPLIASIRLRGERPVQQSTLAATGNRIPQALRERDDARLLKMKPHFPPLISLQLPTADKFNDKILTWLALLSTL